MGGNALKHLGTTRKSSDEYFSIAADVKSKLRQAFSGVTVMLIDSYSEKESFGDIDILISKDPLPANWLDVIKAEFKPQEIIDNLVVSFDYKGIQVDLIPTPMHEMNIAFTYYSFNDLGNLIGRIAHKMGLKYGHNGLWKVLREDTRVIANILVSDEPKEIFKFLGYNYERFNEGFDTLEDIFVFAASTPYFHRDIFQLDNMNHVSRVRDAKRPTYTAFLKWIEDKPELDKYTWYPYSDQMLESSEKEAVKYEWLQKGLSTFPDFKTKYNIAIREDALNLKFKKKWNGKLIGEVTGYTGKKLGFLVKWLTDPSPSFRDKILEMTEVEIKDMIFKSLPIYESIWLGTEGEKVK